MIGVSVAKLQNWEEGRGKPEGPARAFLKIAAVLGSLAREFSHL